MLRITIIGLLLTTAVTAQFNHSTCGTEKICLFAPRNCRKENNCRQILSYSLNGDEWVTIEMFDKITNPLINIMAVGFSEDHLMGDEPVTYCSFGEKSTVHLSYNNGKNNIQLNNKAEFEAKNLELLNADRGNDYLYCKFRQRINPTEESGLNFNLNKSATLFFMHSIGDGAKSIEIHSLDVNSNDFPTVFPEIVNIVLGNTTLNPIIEKNKGLSSMARRKLILLHGCLMVAAWFFFLSIGISASRYLKGLYKDKKPLGTPVWFQIHRTLNMIGVLLLIVATVIVFVANDLRWTGPSLDKSLYENLTARSSMHSLVGFIAVFTAFSQPVGALFRCHPGEKYRKVFEVIHHTIGKSSFLFACISFFLALLIFHVWYSRIYAIIATVAYFAFSGIYVIASEALSKSKDHSSEEYELKHSQGTNGNSQLEERLSFATDGIPRKRCSSQSNEYEDKWTNTHKRFKHPGLLISTIKYFFHTANKEKPLSILYGTYCVVVFIVSATLIFLIQRS